MLARRRPAWSVAARTHCALRAAPPCPPAPTSRCSEAGSCAARPPRRSHSRSPPVAAHSAQTRLAATPPRLTARRRARSPPTGLVGGCSHSLCSARSGAVPVSVPQVDALKRSSCTARPPRCSRSSSPPIAAHSARSQLTAAPPRLTARRWARLPPTGLVGGCSRSLCSARSTAVRAIVQRAVALVRGSFAARPPRRSHSCCKQPEPRPFVCWFVFWCAGHKGVSLLPQ